MPTAFRPRAKGHVPDPYDILGGAIVLAGAAIILPHG
jgi:drug/metabolite transporter superfamily protein YnfA